MLFGGGLLQLVAYGAQDVYLQGAGGILKFKIYYKKHIISNILQIEIIGFDIIKFIKVNYGDSKQFKNMFNNSYESIDCSGTGDTFINGTRKLPKFKKLETFNKLKYFNCSKSHLKQIEKLKYIDLIWLDCSLNRITSIPDHMRKLEYFDISDNNLYSTIDFSNYPKLKYLMISSNSIDKIINLQEGLIYLDISNNPIYEINNLPSSLEYLLAVGTKINSINFTNLTSLIYLDISINNFENQDIFNGLPDQLKYLNCSQCEISHLDNLPTHLNKLICINNNIKTLNMLPETLEYLDCDHNDIMELDNLPIGLSHLICSFNKIKNLNNLPPNLLSIDCSSNNIVSMVNLPKTLIESNIKYDNNNDLIKYNENINGIEAIHFKVKSNLDNKISKNILKKDKKQQKYEKKQQKYAELAYKSYCKHMNRY